MRDTPLHRGYVPSASALRRKRRISECRLLLGAVAYVVHTPRESHGVERSERHDADLQHDVELAREPGPSPDT